MQVFIYEDQRVLDLYPLTLTRHAGELLVGGFRLREWVSFAFGVDVCYAQREYLSCVYGECIPSAREPLLLVNARAFISAPWELPGESTVWKNKDGEIVAVWLPSGVESRDVFSEFPFPVEEFLPLREAELDVPCFGFLWDMVDYNERALEMFFWRMNKRGVYGNLSPGVLVVGKDVYIGSGANIGPGVIIDAREGPVWIADGVKILPGAMLMGPLFIGRGSVVKMGAKIYEGCSFGPVCKVGGEVEETIILGYTNKQHDGFLGHSYLGEWVNIGADTNNSDLKNNYSSVDVWIRGKRVDTGKMFVGLFMGDHSKTGINTMFNTGTVVGVCCNVYGAGFPPKEIPCFAWGGEGRWMEYRLNKAIETAQKAMARRNVELTPAYRQMLEYIFSSTREERKQWLSRLRS